MTPQKIKNVLIPKPDSGPVLKPGIITDRIPGKKPKPNLDHLPVHKTEDELREILRNDIDYQIRRNRNPGYEDPPCQEDPETDFDQYEGEANPFIDEDAPWHLHDRQTFGFADQPDSLEGPSPVPQITPSIIMGWLGDELSVQVPLMQYNSKAFDQHQRIDNQVRDLQVMGELILEKNRSLLEMPVTDFEAYQKAIKPVGQVELMNALKVDKKDYRGTISNLIRNKASEIERYLQLPTGAILPLSWFMSTRDKTREQQIFRTLIEQVLDIVQQEPVNSPFKDPIIFQELFKAISRNPISDKETLLEKLETIQRDNYRNFRNWLNKQGIPLYEGRKHIFEKVEEYLEKEKGYNQSESGLPKLINKLIKEYGLFRGPRKGRSGLGRYLDPKYIQFIKTRIRDILQLKGVLS